MFSTDIYVHVPVCIEAVDNDEVFNTFKRDTNFTVILEHTSEEASRIFLQRILNEFPGYTKKIDWDKVSENDKLGAPILVEYPNAPSKNKLYSPSTIAYAFKALDILRHMKNSNLTNVNILEIGAGYGGQCKMIFDMAPLFNINIESYTLVDLYHPNKLQKKYLSELGYINKIFYQAFELLEDNTISLNKFDYLISIYALSEFTERIRNNYINMLGDNYKYYLLWNTPAPYDRYKNSIIEEERPKTGPFNLLIKSME